MFHFAALLLASSSDERGYEVAQSIADRTPRDDDTPALLGDIVGIFALVPVGIVVGPGPGFGTWRVAGSSAAQARAEVWAAVVSSYEEEF